ncbi:MAG: tetratricopeptide repeat protein [Bacteroidales bacterium]|nr:tetratricopeptide repeat protein [Bacteroidales bacterium]
MKKTLILAIGALLLAACGNNGKKALNHDELVDSIESMSKSLSAFAVATDTAKANQMVALYGQFVEGYPDDSLAPVYLFKKAEINITMGNFEQGAAILDSIISLYPGYEEVDGCMFLKGWAYEQNQQYDLAREAYTEFVTTYPDHVLAADTRKSLPYLGMTPAEQLAAVQQQ